MAPPVAQNQTPIPTVTETHVKPEAADPPEPVHKFEAPQLVRSHLLPSSDRFALESKHMSKLESGGGLLGLQHISLEQRKRDLCKIQFEKPMYKNNVILEKLRMDGVYVDDPEVYQKFTDVNVQKLEERLLNGGKTEFFELNGELKLDNDLLADELTRPADLAFEQSVAFQTKEVNSVLADRQNSFKTKYFRLDIVVGKLVLNNLKNLFCEEDKLALQLREQFKDYETRISLAMIPFYEQR